MQVFGIYLYKKLKKNRFIVKVYIVMIKALILFYYFARGTDGSPRIGSAI